MQAVGDSNAKLVLAAGAGGNSGIVQSNVPVIAGQGIQINSPGTYVAGSDLAGPGSTNLAPFWMNISLGGTVTTGAGSPIEMQIADTMDLTAAPNANILGLTHNLNAGYAAGRLTAAFILNKTAASANLTNPNTLNTIVFSAYSHIDHGDGGTAAAPIGGHMVANPDIRVNTGDWVTEIMNTEMDLRLYAGSNTSTKEILGLHYGIGDGAHASPTTGNPAQALTDAALSLTASPSIGNGSGKGLTMISLGNWTQDVPWDTAAGVGSSIMGVRMNVGGNVSFACNAYIDDAFKLPELYVRGNFLDNGNFVAKGNGDVVSGLARLSATATGSSMDVTGVVAQSATISNGGGNAKVGSELVDSVNNVWQVTGASGGVITSVSLIRAAAVASAPSNPVAARIFGSGSTAQLSVTWSSTRNRLDLQPSGGDTVVGSQAAISTSATGGFLSIPFCAGAPTGAPVNKAVGIAIVYDTTNHKLWAYDNGTSTWKGIVLT